MKADARTRTLAKRWAAKMTTSSEREQLFTWLRARAARYRVHLPWPVTVEWVSIDLGPSFERKIELTTALLRDAGVRP